MATRRGSSLSRRIAAPITAFTMACILFVYARTSISAAKSNAQRHREADGGQISWHRESMRRHGALDVPVRDGSSDGGGSAGGGGSVAELAGELKSQIGGGRSKEKDEKRGSEEMDKSLGRTEQDQKVREMRARKGN